MYRTNVAARVLIAGPPLLAFEGPTKAQPDPMDPQVREALMYSLTGFHRLGQLHRTPDYTLPQLPAWTGGPRRRHPFLDALYGEMASIGIRTA